MREDFALLVASFGTSDPRALTRSIQAVEEAIAERLGVKRYLRAFLSPTVRRKLLEEQGMEVDSVEAALRRIEEAGYRRVLVQPSLVLAGKEYARLCQMVKGRGLKIEVASPLIKDEADIQRLAKILMEGHLASDPQGEDALLLMGHGTQSPAHRFYSSLEVQFRQSAFPGFVAVVEGSPSFESAILALKAGGIKRAQLFPLMLVAGVHAQEDMLGPAPQSLLSQLQAAGIVGIPHLLGLGEVEAVRSMYGDHAQAALERMCLWRS